MNFNRLIWAAAIAALVAPTAMAAPTVTIDLVRGAGGLAVLDANGNWQWKVEITQDAAVNGSLGAELGFRFTGAPLVSSAIVAANFDKDNPGTAIFGWETNNAGVGNAFPGGKQDTLGAAVPVSGLEELFTAFGSVDFSVEPGLAGDNAAKDYLTFTTRGPAAAAGRSLSSTVTLVGSGPAAAGKIGEVTQESPLVTTVFNIASFAVTKTALAGDINLSGRVDVTDLGVFGPNFNDPAPPGGFKWFQGDFNGDGLVNVTDLGLLGPNFNDPAIPAPIIGAAPEPTSALLCVLGLGGALIRRRVR